MADFSWTNAAGGDWSVASNWSPSILNPPPGNGDGADFADLATGYTVTVAAGTMVAAGLDGAFITVDATSALKDVAFSISGSLTADFAYHTAASGPCYQRRDRGRWFARSSPPSSPRLTPTRR